MSLRPAAIFAMLLAFALAAAAPGAAQDNNSQDSDTRDSDAPDLSALFLDEQALLRAFTGAEMEGCYPDGSIWALRTAATGAFHDLLRQGAPRVGDWWVEDSAICYAYSGAHGHFPGTWCWNVIRQNGELYFLFPDTQAVGGATDCVDLVS